jgi:hypothetical protein
MSLFSEARASQNRAGCSGAMTRIRKNGISGIAKKLRENKGIQAGIRWVAKECMLSFAR